MHEDSILKRFGLTTPETRNDMGTSWMALLIKNEIEKSPETFKVDTTFAGAEKAAAANRKLSAANEASKPNTPSTKELDGLRHQRFNLAEHVKNTETYSKIMTDQARGTKDRVTVLLKRKKLARAAGQIWDERALENQVRVLEDQISDFEANAERGRKDHQRAKAALENFLSVNSKRLAELEAEAA